MSENSKISQKHIKNENTKAIFNAIAMSSSISRAEISKQTGLSLMTVGKVADLLSKEGIVTQEKPAKEGAGRRAGRLTLSEDFFIFIADISGNTFKAYAVNLKAEIIDTVTYPYNDSLFPEDNLTVFFRESTSLLLKHLSSKKLIGTGVMTKGNYDKEQDTVITENRQYPDLSGISISKAMQRSMGIAPDIIMSGMEAAAFAQLSMLQKDEAKCVISMWLDRLGEGCIIFGEKLPDKTSNFGALICENGRTLSENLSVGMSPKDEELTAHLLSPVLRSLTEILDPEVFFINTGDLPFSEWFPELIKRELARYGIDKRIYTSSGNGDLSCKGIAMMLREKMTDEL